MICTLTVGTEQAECVNLMERFGKRFKIGFDPAYDPRHRQRENLDPWMMTIPCHAGTIYPHGGDMLAVELDGHCYIRARLRALDCCKVYVEGDDDGTFLFHVDDFRAVAKVVKPRRKRALTPEQKRQAVERLKGHQFLPRVSAVSGGLQRPESTPGVR